jgi:Zn-dependent protease
MLFSLATFDPMLIVIVLVAVLISFTLHEFTHAAVGTFLGDPTARDEGRLSLNPFVHLDFWGFLLFLTGGLGWAKPVPFNPYALKYRWGGTFLIALAGPTMNIFQAVLSAVIIRSLVGGEFSEGSLVIQFFTYYMTVNVILAIFNLIPVPPLDGARALLSLLPDKYEEWKVQFERFGPFLLIWLVLIDAWSGLNAFHWLISMVGTFINYLAHS